MTVVVVVVVVVGGRAAVSRGSVRKRGMWMDDRANLIIFNNKKIKN